MFNKISPELNSNLEENACLFWLDAEIHTSEHNQQVQKCLLLLNKNLKKFEHIKSCQDAIENYGNRNRIILIVSGRLGREIVPQVNDLSQIASIYIYCQDKKANEEWSSQFNKVREVIIDCDILLNEIKLSRRCRAKPEVSLSYNIFVRTDNPMDSFILNKKFTHLLIIIETLLRFESKDDDKHELVSFCKKSVKNEKRQLNALNDFNDYYRPEKAIWWYTRESILYRTVNRLLHTESNFYELPVLHFFINDIFKQLTNNQCQQSVQTYYGKLLWLHELEYLKSDQDKYLSNVSFWLTNRNREAVIQNLINSRNESELQCVLFEIDATPNVSPTKPFADISKLCRFDSQGDIMFMIGSIFHIIDVYDHGDIWIVRLELCSERDSHLKQLSQSMKEFQSDRTIQLKQFADILYRLKKYDGADKIYERLSKKLPHENETCSELYFARGLIAKDKREHATSLEFLRKSLKIKQKSNSTNAISIGKIHACIGAVHRQANDDREALKSFETAIELYKQEHLDTHQNMAVFYDNLADVYKHQNNYTKALEYYEQALSIDENYSRMNSFGVAKSHNNLGCIYYRMKRYEDALKHFLYSLSVKLAIVPAQHSSLAKTYANLASVYKALGSGNEALSYEQKAATLRRQVSQTLSQDRDSRDTDDRLDNIFLSIE